MSKAKTSKSERRYSSPCTLEPSPDKDASSSTCDARTARPDVPFAPRPARRAAIADAFAACLTLFGWGRKRVGRASME
jgi:hypothetical protein